MKCRNCGKEIDENVLFCPLCGSKNDIESYEGKVLFPTIPIWKLILLLILSDGYYLLVWGFKYWSEASKNYSNNINKVIRVLFLNFTSFALFSHVNNYIINHLKENVEHNVDENIINRYIEATDETPFCSWFFATLFCIFLTFSNLISITSRSNTFGIVDILAFTSYVIALTPLIVIQKKINNINNKYNLPAKNDKWTWKTTVLLIIWLFIYMTVILCYTAMKSHTYY